MNGNFEYREFPFTNFAFPDKPYYTDGIARRVMCCVFRNTPETLVELHGNLKSAGLKLTDDDLLAILMALKAQGKVEQVHDTQWQRVSRPL